MRWPEGPPHLALNPPVFVGVFLFCLFLFLSFFASIKKLLFPVEKGIFCLFLSVSLCFSLAFFWPPPFSIALSLSLSYYFLSFFLPVFLFAFFCFLVFVSFFPLLSSLLVFHEKNSIKFFNYKVVFIHLLSFIVFCLVFSLKSLFLIFVFPHFKLCFFVEHQCIWFQKTQVQKHQFLVKRGGCNKAFFL